jgi:K+-transporting ATPase KdpF subunit
MREGMMGFELGLLAAAALATFVYLIFALLRPEAF